MYRITRPSVQDPIRQPRNLRQTHATKASRAKPPITCEEFSCTEKDPCRVSDEKNRVIEIPKDILDAIHFTDQHRLKSPKPELHKLGSMDEQLRMGPLELQDNQYISGTTGQQGEPRVDGSTMSVSTGIAPATFELSLGAKINGKTDRLETVHTFTTAKGQPREKTQDMICEMNTRPSRATGGISGFSEHLQSNLRLSLYPEHRAHKQEDHDAQTDCIKNNRGRARMISFDGMAATYHSNF